MATTTTNNNNIPSPSAIIKSLARRILRAEIEAALGAANAEGYLAREGEVAAERRLAGVEATAAFHAAVEAGIEARDLAKRRSSRR